MALQTRTESKEWRSSPAPESLRVQKLLRRSRAAAMSAGRRRNGGVLAAQSSSLSSLVVVLTRVAAAVTIRSSTTATMAEAGEGGAQARTHTQGRENRTKKKEKGM